MKKLISIIIPAYNEEECVDELATTLLSVALDDALDPPHAVRINRATGTKRFNMVW